MNFLVASALFKQINHAFQSLNPDEVRKMAEEPVVFGVLASAEQCVHDIQDFLLQTSGRDTCDFVTNDRSFLRITSVEDFGRATVGFSEHGIPHPAHFYAFDSMRPLLSARKLLDNHEDLWLPLASRFPGLRAEVSERLILKIARENTLFTVATAVPNIIPSVLTLPWSVGEFASDTAFLTMNQVRLSFLLAAAHGYEPGYNQQSLKITSIIGAAFGWRALARELVSKVPAGGGLVSKGIIAYAGTYAVGQGLLHWYREGKLLRRIDRRRLYEDAKTRSRNAVEQIVDRIIRTSRSVHETV